VLRRAGYLPPAFLLAAQRAFISSESFLRPAGVSVPLFLTAVVFVPADFLLAAQRAFINCDSFRLPAGVSWPFFLAGVAVIEPFFLAQRALAAAESLARVAGEKYRPRAGRVVVLADAPPRIEERRFSRLSICRRIEIASSRVLTDVSMSG
jgi:hypothetical protein